MKKAEFILLTLIAVFSSGFCLHAQEIVFHEDKMLMGGFTEWREPAEDDMQIFTEAILWHNCYRFEPVRLKTQIVAGRNYVFDCIATDKKTGIRYRAEIRVFLSLQNEVSLTGIEIKEELK